jgi:hypothetical protein
MKQISEVEENPFTSSLNIFLAALDRDGGSVASPLNITLFPNNRKLPGLGWELKKLGTYLKKKRAGFVT